MNFDFDRRMGGKKDPASLCVFGYVFQAFNLTSVHRQFHTDMFPLMFNVCWLLHVQHRCFPSHFVLVKVLTDSQGSPGGFG